MNKRGQTIIELMLLLSVSILALSIIYALYSSQMDLSNSSKEASIAKSTINKLVNSANSLSLSGAGSTQRVLIEVPSGVSLIDSNINGKIIYFKLSNGTEVFGFSDVNLVGEFKKVNGVFVNEGYYVNLLFDGQKVIISYDDFELNTNGIFVSAKQGTTVEKVFTIRNNSSRTATFWLQNNFSFPNFAVLSMDSSDVYFTLSPNETRVIDFNIALSNFSSGNYAGSINVIGQINDGISDSNISKSVIVSIESFLNLESVMIFPKSTSFSALSGTSSIKSFSLCNSTNSNVSLTWSRNSNSDANMLDWFTWPILDTDGIAITNVLSGDCAYFDLNFSIPLSAQTNIYDANITITYNDGNTSSSYFFINVSHTSLPYNLFFTTSNNTLPVNYFLSNFVTKRTDTNYIVATGELDWNSQSVNTETSGGWGQILNDFNIQGANLVGVWHLNDKNSSGWVLNSYSGLRDGNLVGDANVSVSGLWNTNAGGFNGTSAYVSILSNNSINTATGVAQARTLSFWIQTTETGNKVIMEKGVGNNFRLQTGTGATVGKIFFSVGTASYSISTSRVDDDRWHHIVMSYDGSMNSLYIDGLLDLNAVQTAGSVNSSPLVIGARGGGTAPFNGSIEDVAIWNVGLNSSEVNQLYLQQKGNWVDSNLVAYYKFNSKNGTTIYDSARANNGTLVSGADINGVGFWDTNAGYFDGTGDYIDTKANTILGASPFTLSAWINTTKVNAYQGAISIGASSNTNSAYIGTVATAQTGTSNSIGGGFFGTNYGSGITTINKWVYVALTYNGTVAKIYVDGNEKVSVNYTANLTNYNIRLGRIGSSTSYDFNGLIEEAKIFNRALSASEILSDYNRFLNAKFVDSNIVDATAVADWNSIKINKDINYSFGKEISLGEKFFDANLVGLWHLNDKNSSGWVLNSATGVRDGNLKNGADTNGVGLWDTNAGWWNGSTSRVDLLDNGRFDFNNTSFTISAFFYLTGWNTFTVCKGNPIVANDDYGWQLNIGSTSKKPGFSYYYNSGSSYMAGGDTNIELGRWYHIVGGLSSSDNKLRLYLDGVLQKETSVASTTIYYTAADAPYIGAKTGCGGAAVDPFNGKIEEVAIWNRALTATEISDLYRKGISKLDLNVYSCSDSTCATKTSSQYITGTSNNVWTELNSNLLNSRYLGFDSFFKKANGFEDYNAGTFYVGSFVNDFNVIYIN